MVPEAITSETVSHAYILSHYIKTEIKHVSGHQKGSISFWMLDLMCSPVMFLICYQYNSVVHLGGYLFLDLSVEKDSTATVKEKVQRK